MSAAAKMVALMCVAGLLVAGAIFVLRPEPTTTVVAEFGQADGVYPGSKVDILGVPIGEVRSVDPVGTRVRATLSLPAGTKVPAQAQAWIMSPAVISDKYVELTPAYTTGATLPDGGVIPPDRAHAPVKWDDLMKSLNTLLTTLAPGDPAAGAPLGDALAAAAKLLDGRGQAFKDAITQVNQASGVVAGQLPDVSGLLDTLSTLVSALDKNKSVVDSVTSSVTTAADQFGKQQDSIASTVEDLSVAMTDLADLLKNHGAELTKDVTQLGSLSAELGKHQGQLAELLDTLPLAGQNLSRAISPDHRLRTRIDVSTNFSQFALGKEFCAKLPLPLCTGAGITNPVRFPPSVNDPLGLPSVLAPPAKTGGN